MQWWFEKFCKGDESLEDEALSGWPLEVDSDQLRAIAEAYSLTATWEVAEELNINYSVVIWHLKQIGKVKKLVKWVLHELTEKKKKIVVLECHQLLFCSTTTNHFLIRLWHAAKSGLYTTAGAVVGPRRSSKKDNFPKPNLQQKKVLVTVGALLLDWYTTAFWILAKPLHLRSMLSKFLRCTENCSACSWQWSTELAEFSTIPGCTLHNQPFKSWMN